jgi:hypothetical protein
MENDFREQSRREATFQGWSHTPPSIVEMAEAGFIFIGESATLVSCFSDKLSIDVQKPSVPGPV